MQALATQSSIGAVHRSISHRRCPTTSSYRSLAQKRTILQISRASGEGDKQTAEDSQLQVPDTPPSKDNTSTSGEEQPMPTSSAEDMSIEEIQRRAAQYRAEKNPEKESLADGVLQEIKMIKWPAPGAALLNTLLVIVIVAATSALLFAVNTGLTEASKAIYPHH